MNLWGLTLLACSSGGSDQTETDSTSTVTDGTEETGAGIDSGTETPDNRVSDAFVYAAPTIDVLFVIDASGSMFSLTEALKGSLNGMVTDWLALGFDFQVGVTNIDQTARQGQLEQVDGDRWAASAHADPSRLLLRLVDAVGDPSSIESGRSAAYKALDLSDPGEPNEGFLRPGSQLAIVVHTDEMDQSGNTPVSAAEFVDYLLALRPPGDVTFHSIVGTADYVEVTNAVGGVAWSVSNTPYGPALQAITDSFHQTRLHLTRPAIEDSIVVRVVPVDQPAEVLANRDWVYDPVENTIELVGDRPDVGATIEIDYETPLL